MKDYVSAMFIYVTNNFNVFVGYFQDNLSCIMFFWVINYEILHIIIISL